MSERAPGEAIRATLDHPVIDADGHTLELGPAVSAYLRQDGVAEDLAGVFEGVPIFSTRWRDLSPEERVRQRTYRSVWWWHPTRNTRDLATAYLPDLLYHRLDELGLDVSIVYPSIGLMFPLIDHDDRRRGSCYSLNRYHADLFAPFGDRLLPVAVIPMHTPAEAIAELEHAVVELGFRAVTMAGYVKRPTEGAAAERLGPTWLDLLGLDSPYDYDPLWRRCEELGVAPTFHSGSQALGFRQSISNYVYNHLGNFAAGSEAVCKALFLGGVSRRFPTLRFGFMEGGVDWAANLYNSLVSYWTKRNRDAIQNYNPAEVDRPLLGRLFDEHSAAIQSDVDFDLEGALGIGMSETEEFVDEWAACEITEARDIKELFADRFYFGCEADDPMIPVAFDRDLQPFGSNLKAMFSSDISHWDVADMREILPEAHEAVEHGRMSDEEFRRFTYANTHEMYTANNPDFFAGTVVDSVRPSALSARR
jgi:predicted TIM-barrel fold metal-dependent hydrolase